MSRILRLLLLAALCATLTGQGVALPGTSAGVGRAAAREPSAQRGRKARKARAGSSASRRNAARLRREKTFRLVWQTVRDEHFDPNFGGVNWDAARALYAPRASRAASDYELHSLLQEMLDELHQSHFVIVPPESIPRFDARRWGAARAEGQGEGAEASEVPEEEVVDEGGSEELSVRMMNGIGVDVRVLGGRVVITRVAAGGPAARAGLKPGFVVKSVGDEEVEGYVGLILTETPVRPLTLVRIRDEIMLNYFGGEPGTEVGIVYVDAENQERRKTVKRERLAGELSPPLGNLPPMYAELESRRLAGDVGYVRFTAFTPQLMERICVALRTLGGAKGLVIDLRGNPGGVMGVASGLAGLLTTEPGLLGSMRTRTGVVPLPSFPQRSPYTGPLVILVDGSSGSTAEIFAAALQESGRARVVGERSAGMVLGADTRRLPTGALLLYARASFVTSDGVALEGRGVVPDVEKKLDRDSLLKGRDEQLEEALRLIQNNTPRVVAEGVAAASSSPPLSSPPPAPRPLPAAQAPATVATGPVIVVGDAPAREEGGVREGSGGESDAAPAAKSGAAARPDFYTTPEAERIMERHIEAVGGRAALAGLKTRVSKGTATLPMQSLTGRIVIYEQAPDKRSMEINVPSMGLIQFAFDGERGWMQHPLMGFVEFTPPMLPGMRRDADFHKVVNYRRQYLWMNYEGRRDKLHVLQLMTNEGSIEEMRFDPASGLLVYHGGMHYDDYRQVGAVKVPFSTRLSFSGLEMSIRLEHVSHDAPVSPSAFAETQSCFTKR